MGNLYDVVFCSQDSIDAHLGSLMEEAETLAAKLGLSEAK
jgi:hypothetical protein